MYKGKIKGKANKATALSKFSNHCLLKNVS
jgi:hypothetical protein